MVLGEKLPSERTGANRQPSGNLDVGADARRKAERARFCSDGLHSSARPCLGFAKPQQTPNPRCSFRREANSPSAEAPGVFRSRGESSGAKGQAAAHIGTASEAATRGSPPTCSPPAPGHASVRLRHAEHVQDSFAPLNGYAAQRTVSKPPGTSNFRGALKCWKERGLQSATARACVPFGHFLALPDRARHTASLSHNSISSECSQHLETCAGGTKSCSSCQSLT